MNHSKTRKIILGVALILCATASIHAQHRYGMHHGRHFRADSGMHVHALLNLTEDQEKKMVELRTGHQKEMLSYRNDLTIKRAELQKYRSADKPDMVLINKTIDEIGNLTTEMQKKQVSHELAVRSLLTEEQRAVFDARREFRASKDGRGAFGPRSFYGGPGGMHYGARAIF